MFQKANNFYQIYTNITSGLGAIKSMHPQTGIAHERDFNQLPELDFSTLF